MIYPDAKKLRDTNTLILSPEQKLRIARKALRRIIGVCGQPDYFFNARGKVVENAVKALEETK